MVQDDIGPEPERYYDWMIWKLRQSKKFQEMRKYSKEKKIEEKHKHSNAIMLDLKELTKCHYDLLKKYQKLYDENQALKKQLDKMQEDNYDEEEANRRMDIIGQNGNDGLHYSEVEDSNLHGPEYRQRYHT